MKLAFDNAKSNFLKLNYGSKLYVFQILQKSFIKIDESGYEVISSSLIEMRSNSTSIPTKINDMDVNHVLFLWLEIKELKMWMEMIYYYLLELLII